MKNNQDSLDYFEMEMWYLIKSLTSIKNCTPYEEYRRTDLMELQDKLREVSTWIDLNILE